MTINKMTTTYGGLCFFSLITTILSYFIPFDMDAAIGWKILYIFALLGTCGLFLYLALQLKKRKSWFNRLTLLLLALCFPFLCASLFTSVIPVMVVLVVFVFLHIVHGLSFMIPVLFKKMNGVPTSFLFWMMLGLLFSVYAVVLWLTGQQVANFNTETIGFIGCGCVCSAIQGAYSAIKKKMDGALAKHF